MRNDTLNALHSIEIVFPFQMKGLGATTIQSFPNGNFRNILYADESPRNTYGCVSITRTIMCMSSEKIGCVFGKLSIHA